MDPSLAHSISKYLGKILPEGTKCEKSALEFLSQSCTEFIHLITTQANELCDQENKKTITPDHIVRSLKMLEFTGYVEPALEELERANKEKEQKPKKKKKKLEDLGIPMEQLRQEQEALFKRARTEMEKRMQEEGKINKT